MIRKLWRKINEPREIRIFFFIVYALSTTAGVSALMHPPQTIQGAIGASLSYCWAASLAIGGVTGLLSVNPGAWWLERIACTCAFVGAGIYAVVVFSLHFTQPGNRIPQACIIGIAFTLFGFRAWRIRGHDYEPRE